MNAIGYMTMPSDFKYKNAFLAGRPKHARTDRFRIRHPEMDHGKRAKIFAPFDALRGFDEAIGESILRSGFCSADLSAGDCLDFT